MNAPFDDLDVAHLRQRTGVKWRAAGPDVIPAWVADMDFAVAPAIQDALRRVVETGEFGYPQWMDAPTPLREMLQTRMVDRYGWKAEADRVREFDDLIHALRVVLDLATKPGDVIAFHTPGYAPFVETSVYGGRTLLPIPMVDGAEGWTFDIERLDQELATTPCTAMLLVNPHNPTGRVFTRGELDALAEVAAQHHLLVISDEIHAELTYAPHQHIPFATLSEDAAQRTVTMTSATKAFNLAGTCHAFAHVGSDSLLAELDSRPEGYLGARNLFGVVATMAAWSEGDNWLNELVAYLDGNRRFVADFVAAQMPGVRHHQPEATFLAWLDFRGTSVTADPAGQLLERAKVMLVDGATMGPGGDGFARLNFGTSRAVLTQILERLSAAL